jgi:biopolymer transport protein ExbB
MGTWEINAVEFMWSGGIIIIPIIICSVFALGIILAKLCYFASINTDVQKLKTQVFEFIKNNKIKEAADLCSKNPSPAAKVLLAGILKFGSSKEDIKEAMEDVSLFEIPKLEKRFTALATIAHITPLLGLLGTVTGMTTSFLIIKKQAASLSPVTPGDLAGSIGAALITTVAGLMVAIPTLVAYNYLVSRVNSFILEMDRASAELLNFLTHVSVSALATTGK